MSDYESPALPGHPKPALRSLVALLSPDEQAALKAHLLGETGAGWIASTLTAHGHPIGKTSVLEYRRSLRSHGKA